MGINPGVPRGHNGSAAISNALEAAVTLDEFTVATLPDAEVHAHKIIFVSDGAAGDPCLAFSDGEDWLRIALGAAVAAS